MHVYSVHRHDTNNFNEPHTCIFSSSNDTLIFYLSWNHFNDILKKEMNYFLRTFGIDDNEKLHIMVMVMSRSHHNNSLCCPKGESIR